MSVEIPISDREGSGTEEPVLELPVRLQIESTAKCNFRCGSCQHSFEGYDRRNLGHLSRDRFLHVIDQLPGLRELELQGVGEPFLNPDVPAMIRDATYRNVQVHTFTNGSVLSDRIADEIVDAQLHSMTFSIDGATKDVFETLRPGGKFETVLANIQRMVEAKKRAGSEHPYLNFNTVVSRKNAAQLSDILKLAESYGEIRNLTFVRLNTLIAPEWRELRLDVDKARELVETLKAQYKGEVNLRSYFDSMSIHERKTCWWPKQWVYISVEGFVTPCCNYCDPREFNLGNVFTTPFHEIWHGAAYRRFRHRLRQGEFRHECAAC